MVAETIRQQIGGSELLMLGAHMFTKTENSLCFRIRGSQKVDLIQITLDPLDTYTLEFWKRSTRSWDLGEGETLELFDWHLTESINGVFWDMLCDLIERETGILIGPLSL